MGRELRTCNRRRLLAGGFAIPLILTSYPHAALSKRGPVLSGTFLQLLTEHHKWSVNQWVRLFEAFRRLRLTRIIVQWATSGGQRFYVSPQGSVVRAPLETILELGEKNAIGIMIGLVDDPDYWTRIAQPSTAVAAYLADRESRIVQAVTEIVPLARSYSSFAGWFMNEEIDDISWREPSASSVLHSYLHRVSDYLRLVVPNATVALSGFSNAHASPAQLQTFWYELLRTAPAIDTVLFQDGIGVHKLTLENLPVYLRSARAATDAAGRQLWSVVELFEQTGGAPLDQAQFRANAAPFTRIVAQLQIEAEFASKQIAFSAADYMLAPTQQATDLLSSYLEYVRA